MMGYYDNASLSSPTHDFWNASGLSYIPYNRFCNFEIMRIFPYEKHLILSGYNSSYYEQRRPHSTGRNAHLNVCCSKSNWSSAHSLHSDHVTLLSLHFCIDCSVMFVFHTFLFRIKENRHMDYSMFIYICKRSRRLLVGLV